MRPTTIRKLLTSKDFDWEAGAVIVPVGEKGQNVIVPSHSPALDQPFHLHHQTAQSGLPIFTAEDASGMYFICTLLEEGRSNFHKVNAEDLEGVQLEGIRGFPSGPKFQGMDLTFKNPLEVFVTKSHCVPAYAGCPQIHHYCTGEDRKAVMDLFTIQLLTGYMHTRNEDSERKGYAKILERLFRSLDVTESVVDPIEKD